MVTVTTILLPTDGSEGSKRAMGYALYLAKQCGARVVGLHVIRHRWDLRRERGLIHKEQDVARKIRLDDEAEERRTLQEIADAAAPLGIAVETRTVTGSPSEEIVRLAKEQRVDLIIMGTHGRTGISHFFLGSVAEKVVRSAPCPVLTVHPNEHELGRR